MRNEPNTTQEDWCRQILTFEIDEGVPELSFRDRLARENGWTHGYAQRVIDEYLRFVCLAMVSGHVVTPSDQVDQAWHLHLTYTRSYWDRLCGDVLKRPLHHGPTRGGSAESIKYHDHYERTIASYAKLFGQSPPVDIWPPAEIRFGSDLTHMRVNTARHWVIPKPGRGQYPAFLKLAFGSCLLVGLSAGFGGTNQHQMAIGGFDFGPIGERIIQSFKGLTQAHRPLFFFEFVTLLISLCLFITFQIYRQVVKKFVTGSDIDAADFNPGAEAESLHNVQIARLLSTDRRSVEVALTELTTKGLCRVSDDKLQIVREDFSSWGSDLLDDAWSDDSGRHDSDFDGDIFKLSPLAKAVLGLLPIKRGELIKNLKEDQAFYNANKAINNELIRRKLIPAQGFFLRLFQVLLRFQSSVLLAIGLLLLFVSGILVLAEFEQVWPHALVIGLLGAALVKTTISLWSEIAADRQATRRGRVVTQLIKSRVGLGKLSLADNAALVAIFGTASLSNCVDPEFVRLHEWCGIAPYPVGDSSGGCSGCSVGGCGGGGW